MKKQKPQAETVLSENALNVFKRLYFYRDETTPEEVFERVAKFVTQKLPQKERTKYKKEFVRIMSEGVFRPNTPCLMNAGCTATPPQTSACFVEELKDDLISILDFDRTAALVFKSGSGIGTNYGALREKGASLSTGGCSSGPMAFLRKISGTAEAVRSGGRSRRAALMSMFTDTHPDLLEFITLKNGKDQDTYRAMNLSVAITDAFMEAALSDKDWYLKGVVDGETKAIIPAKEILHKIAENAYRTGDPGVWFINRANLDNGLIDEFGPITSTNPCGEQSLLPKTSCALASINLTKFIISDSHSKQYFDHNKFLEACRLGVRFLDYMIDISGYPTEDFKEMGLKARPIGLGIMGFADMLHMLEIPYDSDDAILWAREIAQKLTKNAVIESIAMGEEYGSFSAFERNEEKMTAMAQRFLNNELFPVPALRNSQWTTIAPTGSISISADCSPGMEPLFGICYVKNVADTNEKWYFVNPIFEQKYKDEPWYEQAIKDIAQNKGSCQGLDSVPENVQKIWKVAHDIDWLSRLKIQAAFQENISNAISSTVNLPHDADVETIEQIYYKAHSLGLKGVTVFRDGCLNEQPVNFGGAEKEPEIKSQVRKIRPKIRNGVTHEVQTGHGKIYLTVNRDPEGNVIEIFTNGGKNGSVNASNLEAIARLASIALQNKVPVIDVAKTLTGINDGTLVWEKLHPDDQKSQRIISIPDAIAKVLLRFYADGKPSLSYIPDHTQEADVICTECGSQMYYQEGCMFCPLCGSKCG